MRISRIILVAAAMFVWTSSIRASCAGLPTREGWVSQILSCQDVRPILEQKVEKVPADYIDHDRLFHETGSILVVMVFKTRTYERIDTEFRNGITNDPIKWTGPWHKVDDPSSNLRTVFWRGGKCEKTDVRINFLFDQPCCDTWPVASASCFLEIPTVTTEKQLRDFLKSTIPRKRFDPPPPMDIPEN